MAAYPSIPVTDERMPLVTGIQSRVTRSGKVRTVSTQTTDPREITLTHEVLDSTQAQTLRDFYSNNKTAEFTYTSVDGTTFDCTFRGRGVETIPAPGDLWSATAEFHGTPQ